MINGHYFGGKLERSLSGRGLRSHTLITLPLDPGSMIVVVTNVSAYLFCYRTAWNANCWTIRKLHCDNSALRSPQLLWSYQWSSSHVGSGIVPVDGVGRISYGHCLYHASPFCSITCIFSHQSIFLYFILHLLFPRFFQSSSTTTHFKFQSLHYHIFIFFPQNMTVPPLTSSYLETITNMSMNSSLFLRSSSFSFTPHIALIINLFVLLKIAFSFSLKYHASLPYNIADLTQLL